MINVSPAVHRPSACVCGHAEHTGHGWKRPDVYRCPECTRVETEEKVSLAFITLESAAALAIGEGVVVRLGDQKCRIVNAAEVTKLNGKYHTGFVRLKLREQR